MGLSLAAGVSVVLRAGQEEARGINVPRSNLVTETERCSPKGS